MKICICGKGSVEVILKPDQLELFHILAQQHQSIGEILSTGKYRNLEYDEISLNDLKEDLNLVEGSTEIVDRSVRYFKILNDSYDTSLCCVDITGGIVILVNERNTKTWIPSYSVVIREKTIDLPSFGEIYVVGSIPAEYFNPGYVSEIFLTRQDRDFYATVVPKNVRDNRRNPVANAIEMFGSNSAMMTIMSRLFDSYNSVIVNVKGEYTPEFMQFNKNKVIELMYRYDMANGLTGYNSEFTHSVEPESVMTSMEELSKMQDIVFNGMIASREVTDYFDRVKFLIVALHRRID